ncbi:MAG: hypothetical protein LYZ66_00805 [Nitrososphaerales archaeon]|nr:hypothetical protein [Nitrososphaerales archaeon]
MVDQRSAVGLDQTAVTTFAISANFLGEAMTTLTWTGAALILVSVLLVSGLEIRNKSLSVSNSKVGTEHGS